MMRALALGIGLGLGHAVWISRPALVQPMGSSFAVLLVLIGGAVFLAGRARRGDPVSVATAEATAIASNVVTLNVHAGAAAAASREFGSLDEADWQPGSLEVGDADDIAALLEEGSLADDYVSERRGGQDARASRPAGAPSHHPPRGSPTRVAPTDQHPAY